MRCVPLILLPVIFDIIVLTKPVKDFTASHFEISSVLSLSAISGPVSRLDACQRLNSLLRVEGMYFTGLCCEKRDGSSHAERSLSLQIYMNT